MCGQLTRGLVVIQGMDNQISGVVSKVGFRMLVAFFLCPRSLAALFYLYFLFESPLDYPLISFSQCATRV